MKKLISLLCASIIAFSTVCANAATPEFLSRAYNNYSSEQTFSVEFNSSESVYSLLEEVGFADWVNDYVDLDALLKSLFSLDTKMSVKLNASDDYSRIEMSMESVSNQKINVNDNLSTDINSKSGMWCLFDIKNEIFKVIYKTPVMNKYAYLDISDTDKDEEVFSQLRTIFNKEFFEVASKFSSELLSKYADIKIQGANCIIKIDNEALLHMIGETVVFITSLLPESDAAELTNLIKTAPDLSGIKLLGDDGITYKYSLIKGRPSSMEMKADICLNIAEIYSQLSGMEWEYESDGIIDFTIKSTARLSKYGDTKVVFPELTDENSVKLYEPIDDEYEPDYEYEMTYPRFYAYGYTEKMPFINGEYYVPLEETMMAAYDENADIQVNGNNISVLSEYFKQFDKLEFVLGSDVAYVDGAPVKISPLFAENDIVYISAKAIETIFGWELWSATHNLLDDTYDYSFYTIIYD